MNEDSLGLHQELKEGDVSYWNCGKGVVLSQVPTETCIRTIGLHLRINLKNKERNCEPSSKICTLKYEPIEGTNDMIKLISGKYKGKDGTLTTRSPLFVADIILHKGSEFKRKIEPNWNTFAISIEGELLVQG